MALLERVSTLMRANINDLLTKAEDPEKMAKQLVLDMENQLMQVKTQVAMAIADQHMLKKKLATEEGAQAQWVRKAELAVTKGQDEMARAALERSLNHQRMGDGLREQLADQTEGAETLRAAYTRLEKKLTETRGQVDLLTTQLRRTRAAAKAQPALDNGRTVRKLALLADKVEESTARSQAGRTMLAVTSVDSLEDQFAAMEQGDEIEALLLELKERQPQLTRGGDGE